MLPKGQRVLVDTNVIIESHRVKCWNALAGYFAMETVEMCCTEAGSGNPNEPGYITVDTQHLRQTAKVHTVTQAMIVSGTLRAGGLSRLDPGEKELLAFATTQDAKVVISSPDLRALMISNPLGLLDRFISLEELVDAVGVHPKLAWQYTKDWLTKKRTAIKLDSL